METPIVKNIPKKLNANKVNLTIDIAIFLIFLVTMAPRFSGLLLHEWLSIAFGATIFVHLLLHWQWIVQVTRRFLAKATWESRINYILNALLFVSMTVVIFTGLMISEFALPQLGIRLGENFAFRRLHTMSADATVILVGVHVALHWQWMVNAIKRYLLSPFFPRRAITRKETAVTERKANV